MPKTITPITSPFFKKATSIAPNDCQDFEKQYYLTVHTGINLRCNFSQSLEKLEKLMTFDSSLHKIFAPFHSLTRKWPLYQVTWKYYTYGLPFPYLFHFYCGSLLHLWRDCTITQPKQYTVVTYGIRKNKIRITTKFNAQLPRFFSIYEYCTQQFFFL